MWQQSDNEKCSSTYLKFPICSVLTQPLHSIVVFRKFLFLMLFPCSRNLEGFTAVLSDGLCVMFFNSVFLLSFSADLNSKSLKTNALIWLAFSKWMKCIYYLQCFCTADFKAPVGFLWDGWL